MEERFIDKWIKECNLEWSGECKNMDKKIWYNKEGDCIQFLTEQVAVIGDRIDEVLTIYRSAENENPIGFQLKDVREIIKRFGLEGMVVEASVKENILISVAALLFRAFTANSPTISRVSGYAKAMESLSGNTTRVSLPEGCLV